MVYKLWFQPMGIGDHIQASSVIPYLLERGDEVEITFPARHHKSYHLAYEVLYHIPGVKYRFAERCPLNFESVYPFNRKLHEPWSRYGLDWYNKRLWYHPTTTEKAYGETFWLTNSDNRPRCVVQCHGSTSEKEYPLMSEVVRFCAERFSTTLIDTRDVYENCSTPYVSKLSKHRPMRDNFGVIATADLFVGFDSGPFYVALGSGVSSFGLFPCAHPELLYYPVTTPKSFSIYCKDHLQILPVDFVLSKLESFIKRVV